MRSVAALAVITFLLVAASASGGGSPIRVVPAVPGGTTYRCSGAQTTLFDNSNGGGVQNGGKPATFSTGKKTYCLASITTYHWNNGQGAAPGSIGLKVVSGLGGTGNTLGPLAATGSAGQGGAQNVNWTATAAQPIVLNGSYACQDSDPATWSQNPASNGPGLLHRHRDERRRRRSRSKPAKPTYVCLGSQVKLFDNSNGGGVQNGGKPPSFTTYGTIGVTAWCLNSITTYHWNNGTGEGTRDDRTRPAELRRDRQPGRPAPGDGQPGQGGAPNVNWTVNYPTTKPVVVSGTYTCKDSDPATWAQNQADRRQGLLHRLRDAGVRQQLHAAVGRALPAAAAARRRRRRRRARPTSTSHVKCFTGTLSTMLLYPIHVAPDQWGLLLLQCAIKQGDGFQGRLTPVVHLRHPPRLRPVLDVPVRVGQPAAAGLPPVHRAAGRAVQHGEGRSSRSRCGTTGGSTSRRATRSRRRRCVRPRYGVFVRYGGGDVQAQNTWNVK